ncbi:MAG: hypothetical protein ABJD13_14460 [Paracoccaceae bacterium]
MILQSAEKTEILERLQDVLNAPDLPPKTVASCSSLFEKLQQPVRIGILGLPNVGKRRVINVLLQEQERVLDPNLTLPTLNLSFGEETQTSATFQNGATVTSDGYPDQDTMQLDPMFLQISAPLKQIEGREYLLIAADPTLADMTAALAWAATRVDVALYCTQTWSSFEQQIWRSAPETLRNHAVLVVTGTEEVAAPQNLNVTPEDGFETLFKERSDASSDLETRCQFGGLTRHLQNTISAASTEDIHAAQLFLHRYGDRFRTRSKAIKQADPPPGLLHAPEIVPDTTFEPSKDTLHAVDEPLHIHPHKEDVPEDAVIALSKLFQFLRRSAEGLRQQFPTPRLSQDDAEHHLSALDEIFDQLAERANEQDVLEEHWPDLCDTIHDARDLALLMRIEGGLDQVRDAAMLLLQVRQDVEFRLVA